MAGDFFWHDPFPSNIFKSLNFMARIGGLKLKL